jgi:uncharacterized repeat protein (TIGR01451 family)
MGVAVRERVFRPALRGISMITGALVVAAGLTVVSQSVTAGSASAAQSPTSCQGGVSLVNGGFEQPTAPAGSWGLFTEAQVPGWSTTDSRGQIELWSSGFLGVPAAAGTQFAELNANSASRLYQDVATTPGQTLSWSLKHRGRNGTDVMRVVVGAPGGTLAQSGPNLSDGTTAWGTHSGTYTVPAGQTVTRFGFEAVTSVGGAGVGNFLDDITFGTGPCLISTKTVTNLTRGGTTAEVGDVLRYTVTTRNDGGNPALQSVSTDVLDSGIDFVPGSLRIVSGPGAGALTDSAGDDRGDYTAGDRTVRVRLGTAATASVGGSIGVGTATTFTFDARVNVGASDTTIDNEASVGFRDAVANQNRTSTTQTTVTPVNPAADLAVTKTLDTAPIIAGEPVSFTISATNHGPHTGTGVTLTDTLPTGLTGVTVSGADCITAASAITCALPDLAVGATTALTVTGIVSPSLSPGSAIANSASIAGARTDPDPRNNTATASGIVTTLSDVSILKEFAPAAPVAGQNVTYTLTARNDGPSDARDVMLTDPLDPQTTFVSAAVDGDPCAFDGTSVLCAVGTLAPGESATATVTVTLATGANAVVQNTATVTTTTSDSDPTDNADSIGFQPTVIADVAVEKTASQSAVEAGDPISFTLTVSNVGPSDATDVVLTDALPVGFAYTGVDAGAGVDCTTDGPAVRCVWGALAAGASEAVTVHAVIDAGAPAGSVTNTASVAAPADDEDTSNNSDSVDVEVVQSADVRLAKSASPATGVPGLPQDFVLTVTNDGPSVARGVRISDPLPAGFSVAGTDPRCAALSGVLECEIGDLAPNAGAQVTVSGTLAATSTGVLENTATADSATPDPDDTNNTATVQLPLAPSADVSLTKTTSTPQVSLGGTVRYVVTVRNAGPSAAAAVVVDESPGAGIRITAAVPSVGSWSAGDARWDVGTLTPGAEATLEVTAVAEAVGTLENTATARSATPDPDTADLSGTAQVAVSPVADLSIVKAASVSPVAVNGEITYTLKVENHGPSVATNVVVTDVIPAELIGASTATPGCTITDGVFTCTSPSLDVGGTREYRFTATVDPATASESVVNVAQVTSATPDADTVDNSSTVETPVTGAPQVELVKSAGAPVDADGDGRIGAGDTVPYTFTVRNTGPTVLSGVVIDDPLLGGTVECAALEGVTVPPAGEVDCAPVSYTLTQGDVDAGSVRNEATVTAQSPRGEAEDDAAANALVFRVNAISLAKSATGPVDVNGDGRIEAGDAIDYSFTVENTGTTTLTGAEIADPLLGGALACPELDGVALEPGDAIGCGPVRYPLTQQDVDAAAVENSASVTALSPGGSVSDTADADVTVEGTDAVELVKSAGAVVDADGDGRIGAGDVVPYTFTVRNAGTTTLTGAVVADPMLGGELDCPALDGAALRPGDAVDCGPVSYTLTQDDIESGAVRNQATATATGAAGVVTDDGSTELLIEGVAEIALTKTAGTPVDATGDGWLGAGDTVDYRFTIRNTGTTVLTDLQLADPLLGGAVDCDVLEGLELLPGDEAACGPVTYTLTQAEVDAQIVRNEATVTAQSRNADVDDTATADVEVLGTNGLALLKSAGAIVDANGSGRTDAGDTIAYTFAVENTGTTTVTHLTISDPRLSGEIVCEATSLAPGELTVCQAASASLTQAEIDAGEIVNTATVAGTGPGQTQVEAEDSVTTPITAQPAVALEKIGGDYADVDGDRTVSAGDTVRFRFVVTNTGAVTLTGITLADPKLGGAVACDIPDLAPGESAECGPVSYAITAEEAAAGSVTNAATVSATAATVVVSAADSVTVDLSLLAVTGGVVSMLPWAIALLMAGAIVLLIARVRRPRHA